MADPFISSDRRPYLLADLASDVSSDDAKLSKKDAKEGKDGKDGKDKNDFEKKDADKKMSDSAQAEIVSAAAADASATGSAVTRMTVGQRWAKPDRSAQARPRRIDHTEAGVNPTVLIVAGPHDDVACRLHEALQFRGVQCEYLDGVSAATAFTIRVDDTGVGVCPDVPLFLRASAWGGDASASDDERFLREEAYATLWAAAALSRSPVINRPTSTGPVGRLTVSGIASRTGIPMTDVHRELYVSDPAMAVGRLDPPMWGEDSEFRTREFAALPQHSPARLRSVVPDACYEIVSTVGARAFSVTDDPRSRQLGLLDRSLAMADSLGLNFATVTWSVSADDALPARVNAQPDTAEMYTCIDAVVAALSEELAS